MSGPVCAAVEAMGRLRWSPLRSRCSARDRWAHSRKLAFQNGVSQVVLMPFEDGVIEFGNARTSVPWENIPTAPTTQRLPYIRMAASMYPS